MWMSGSDVELVRVEGLKFLEWVVVIGGVVHGL